MNNAWQAGIVAAGIPVGIYALQWYQTRRALRAPPRATTVPAEFQGSVSGQRWCFVGIAAGFAGASGLVLTGWPGRYFVAIFPLLFCLLCWAALRSYRKILVTVDEESVVSHGHFRVPRDKIRSVFLMSGYIVIDIGEKNRLTIPLLIDDPAGLLHILRETRKNPPNQEAEPTRTSVTPPADTGDRASGAPCSP